MKIEKIINLLGTMFDRLYEVDSEACVSLIKPHVVESQAFLIQLQEALGKLAPTEIVESGPKFSGHYTEAIKGQNGHFYFQRSLDNYSYMGRVDPDASKAITFSVFLKNTDAGTRAFSEDSKEYKEAMTLYEIAEKLSMFKPILITRDD